MVMRRVAERCEQLGVAYFITGSVASGIWGESRHTQDVDFAVNLPRERAAELCAVFQPPDWYADAESARQASDRGGQFNIIYIPEAVKADIMTLADVPFNRSRFSRRQLVALPGGGSAMFASPEDVILKKLEYRREGGSDKHLRDIAGIVRVSGGSLDLQYVTEWADALGVGPQWSALRSSLGI